MTVTVRGRKCETNAIGVTGSNVLSYMVSASVLLFHCLFLCVQNSKYKYGSAYTSHNVFTYDSSNANFFHHQGSLDF